MSATLGMATIVDLVRSGALCAKFDRFDLVLDNGSAKTYDLRPILKEAGIHWNVNTGTWRKQVTSKEREAIHKVLNLETTPPKQANAYPRGSIFGWKLKSQSSDISDPLAAFPVSAFSAGSGGGLGVDG